MPARSHPAPEAAVSDGRLPLPGATLRLLPERAAFWEETGTLLVADPHFGKGAAFRFRGVPVPAGTTGGNLARLDMLLDRLPVRRLVFLGDFLHAREGRAPRTLAALRRWRETRPELPISLVRGNHDRRAGDPPPELAIECVDDPWSDGPLALAHLPRAVAGRHAVAGHLHPTVRLIGPGRQRKRLPCFWSTPDVTVLPSFGDFTGGGLIEPTARDRVFVVAGDEVVEVR